MLLNGFLSLRSQLKVFLVFCLNIFVFIIYHVWKHLRVRLFIRLTTYGNPFVSSSSNTNISRLIFKLISPLNLLLIWVHPFLKYHVMLKRFDFNLKLSGSIFNWFKILLKLDSDSIYIKRSYLLSFWLDYCDHIFLPFFY
jgi:hypothetical protein